MKPWYRAEIKDVARFFDVDIKYGLGQQSVLARIKKFGYNNDPTVSADVEKAYKTQVLRGNQKQTIGVKNLVPGDVVIIKEGDRVPADLRLFKVNNLKIDQSALTGEALTSAKNTYALKKEAPPADQKCMAFMGSFVGSGGGIGVVVRQAHASEFVKSLPRLRKNSKILANLTAKKLKRAGILVQAGESPKRLNKIDTILININLNQQEIQNLIINVQLAKNIDCKFINQNVKNIEKDAKILDLTKFKKQSQQKIAKYIEEAQFINGAKPDDIVKILNVLKNSNSKVLYVSDGLKKDMALKSAYVSMLVGDWSRGDNIAMADLLALSQNIAVLERI